VLLAAGIDDPVTLSRAACVCTAMRAAAELAWLPVCARAWPQCAPANAAAARAACAAHRAATAHSGATPPAAAPRADASELLFTVHVTSGASKALLLFAGSISGGFLRDAQEQRPGAGPHYERNSDVSPEFQNLLLAPPPLAVAQLRGASPNLRAALYVQRVRDGCAEVACLYTGRAHPWPSTGYAYHDSYFTAEEVHELNQRQTFLFEAPTSGRPPRAAPKDAYEGTATWATCVDVRLHVEYEPLTPLTPPGQEGDELADAAEEAFDEWYDDDKHWIDDVDKCWYDNTEPKRVKRMHATLAVETRLVARAPTQPGYGGYDSEGPGSCTTSPEDLAVALDSLTWCKMPA
jgi:hypothetical protein